MNNTKLTFFSRMLLPALILAAFSCVDQVDFTIGGKINTIVIDGQLTTADEEQAVRIYRAKSDEATGRFGSTPLSGVKMELLADGTQTVPFTESTEQAGYYTLPAHFRGQTGKTYQLRFSLPDGTTYESTPQKLEPVPAMTNVRVNFNAKEAAVPTQGFNGFHEFYIDTQDPADQRNFYSWEWTLYEKQDWCKSCMKGIYAVNKILPGQYLDRTWFVSGDEPFEDCFAPVNSWNSPGAPSVPSTEWTYDYQCRTQCWEVFRNPTVNIFEDGLVNGGKIQQRQVAKIPFYQHNGCLVELRQLSLNKDAYEYFKLFQQQTENAGGITDTPPTALRGNIRNIANDKESVVGYFNVTDVSIIRYWLDRRDTPPAIPPGLFEATNKRTVTPEPPPPSVPLIRISGGPPRVPTALCIRSEWRTPLKPEGWNDAK